MKDLSVDGILGPGGALASVLPGFEHRPEQLEVARAVERAFNGRHYLMAEAGTGTGKTLAYLVPSILSGRKVVISTGTKNLQEQIFFKDIPLLRDQLGLAFEAAYLKGRTNYLCLQRFGAKAQSPSFETPEDAALWPKLVDWAERTQSGDRAELDLPEEFPGWKDLSATSEQCLGQRCPLYESCFVTRVRRLAEASDVLVVNHHLFFADLALRSRNGGEGVLPRYDAVVFDEAHALESVAGDSFGVQVSSYRLDELAADAQRVAASQIAGGQTLAAMASRLKWNSDDFVRRARAALRLDFDSSVRLQPGALTALSQLEEVLESLHSLGAFSTEDEDADAFAISRRANEIAEELQELATAERSERVYWAESRGRGLFLRAAPIEVGEDLQRRLFSSVDTVIFTSATITAAGRFDFFARRMGLAGSPDVYDAPRVETVCVESPFDFPSQAALYVPSHLPEPSAPHFAHAVADEVVELCAITGGRAFALFTSLKNMEAAWEAAKDRLPYQVLLQGERPKSALLEAFKTRPSVLFASHSFWEGVDVPGDALSLVVIDKLPFASPSDPRVSARIDLLNQRGEDPFGSYQLPEAAIALRQGFGRLIRSSSDRGIVAILDPRLKSKGYGRAFIRSLPPARRVADKDDLKWWFDQGATAATG